MIEIWYLCVSGRRPSRWDLYVTEAELARARRFRHSDDAMRFIGSRALTRVTLASILDVEPAHVLFSTRCEHCDHPTHGRPTVSGDVHFSATRAGALVAIALAKRPVGLDAEPRHRPAETLLRSEVFAEEERTHPGLARRDGPVDPALTLFAMKEAIGKASGLGLVRAGDIRANLDQDDWKSARDALGRRCTVKEVELPGVVAAVATFGPPELIGVRDAKILGL